MSFAMIVFVLILLWAAITGNFDGPNLLLGVVIGVVVATVLQRGGVQAGNLRRLRSAISLSVMFVYELWISAVRVARVVLAPNMSQSIRPGIIAYPLSVQSDAEITLLANLITLTPGTLSIDVSPDRKLLYVHALTLQSRDQLVAEIANGFEAKVREVYR